MTHLSEFGAICRVLSVERILSLIHSPFEKLN